MIQPTPLCLVCSALHHMQVKNMAKIKSLIICQGKILRKPLTFTNIWNWKRGHSKDHEKKPWTPISTYSPLKYHLTSKMSTWMHPTFCLVAGFKTLTYAQVFVDFTITEIDMIERKTKKKIYDFSLYNGFSGQTYNFFPKPTFFFVSVSFSFFCHC